MESESEKDHQCPHERRQRMFSALVAGAIAIAIAGCATEPAAAPPISAPQAIDEGKFVNINGVEQLIAIRGNDIRNPILLYLQGGPGIGAAFKAPACADWQSDFTIVLWDQPGGGSTDLRNVGNPGPQTLDRYTRDAIAVAEYVRERLGQQSMIVFGNSWGTQLALELIHRRLDLASAYVGIDSMNEFL